jgi:hypothetical protein
VSDKEINKVHLEAEQDNRHRFDLTLKGEADNAGVRSVGSAADGQAALAESKEQKKQKELMDLLYIQGLQDQMGDLLDDIKDKMDEYRQSRDRQKRMNNCVQDGDFATLRLIFIEDYHMDADEVDAMSPEDLIEEAQRRNQGELDTQAVLRAEIRELALEYKERAQELGQERPALAEAEMEKLDAIKYRASALGFDFEELLRDETLGNGLEGLQAVNIETEQATLLNETFNKVAPDIGGQPTED